MRISTRHERGAATISVVAAASMGVVFFIVLANLVVIQYGRGVARLAVDEAVRRGAVVTSPVETCREAGQSVLDDLLGGSIGVGLDVDCAVEGGSISSSVRGRFRSFAPMVPDVEVAVGASKPLER